MDPKRIREGNFDYGLERLIDGLQTRLDHTDVPAAGDPRS
jgi:hypothetical protein